MKTRREILESHHDSALAKLLEDEINLAALQERAEKTKPGADYDKLQEAIKMKEINMGRVKTVLKIIERMYRKEPDQDAGKEAK